MIWYLLYPFRGTTEAPILAPSHPLRYAFTRYGRHATRHVLATLLLSISIALILIYPCFFLYSNEYTSGTSVSPHHVWTDAQLLDDKSATKPDVIMRSIWVHGSYMQALDREVLLGALELQDELLGSTRNFKPRQPMRSMYVGNPSGELRPEDRDKFHIVNGLTNQSWFFHSPLLYWGCSTENIEDDKDILATVNERKSQLTSVNVTLRHSIVFSGKRFEERRLVAADALAITLIHLPDSPVGRQWERRAEALAARMSERYQVIPADGRSMSSQLYEFQFRPLSVQDSATVALAYFITLYYFITSFSKLRAVRSRLGLFIAAWFQIVASTVSSLTICAVFKVDLSRIPYFAYPMVVATISMENSFRLINAVTKTSPNHGIVNRIGEAFGETAHVAVASRAQNLLILWGLSKITFPGVSAFCTFAGIAIIFDFFYLSTFFLSVLSVDVQRTELSDALEKVPRARETSTSATRGRQTWTDALIQGKTGLSTRVAGTIVIVGSVLIAQWHFLERESVFRMLSSLFNKSSQSQLSAPRSSLLIDIHQARSPTSWLRLQDHETAREVINVVKPWAHSYVARFYDPLVFVLKNADRNPHYEERWFLPAVYDFVHHELSRFVVLIAVVVALIRILMNYLLWDEMAAAKREEDPVDQPLLSVKSLTGGHMLDIAMLAATSDGHLVSVGLDRIIQVWDVRSSSRSRVIADPGEPIMDPFPVLAMAIDKTSTWLAVLSPHKILLWNLHEHRWCLTVDVDMNKHKHEAFLFDAQERGRSPSLLVVRRDGVMFEIRVDTDECSEHVVSKTPFVCAVPFEGKASQGKTNFLILAATRKGHISQIRHDGDSWSSQETDFSTSDEHIHSILAFAACDAYLIARTTTVDLVDLRTSVILHTFQTESMQPRSLRIVRGSVRQARCGSRCIASFTLAYTATESHDCVLQTYLGAEEDSMICFCDAAARHAPNCTTWTKAKEVKRRVQNPGDWEALQNGSVVGVRRLAADDVSQTQRNGVAATLATATLSGIGTDGDSAMRRRRGDFHSHQQRQQHWTKTESWEVWVMSQLEGEQKHETLPLFPAGLAASDDRRRLREGEQAQYDEDQRHLMISQLGPLVKIGSGSVACGFGHVAKVVTVGHERFDDGGADGPADSLTTENLMSLTANRRRRPGPSGRNSRTSTTVGAVPTRASVWAASGGSLMTGQLR